MSDLTVDLTLLAQTHEMLGKGFLGVAVVLTERAMPLHNLRQSPSPTELVEGLGRMAPPSRFGGPAPQSVLAGKMEWKRLLVPRRTAGVWGVRYFCGMSREYKTGQQRGVYGAGMDSTVQEQETHRRPPADWLFCRGDGAHAEGLAIAEGERAHFAEHFARDFAAALKERRPAAFRHDRGERV